MKQIHSKFHRVLAAILSVPLVAAMAGCATAPPLSSGSEPLGQHAGGASDANVSLQMQDTRSLRDKTEAVARTVSGTGVKGLRAEVRIYPSHPMIDTIIVEYGDVISLPTEDPQGMYRFADLDRNLSGAASVRQIEAVYTSDEPRSNTDRASVPGRYVIIELEEIRNPNPQQEWTIPSDAGLAVWTPQGSDSLVLRADYGDIELQQLFDARTATGSVVQRAGRLPNLRQENISWPELEGFSIGNVFQGSGGDIYYSYHLPENYDPKNKYPLVVTLPGYGAHLHSTAQNALGVNVYADRTAIAWTQADEDVIVLAPQLTGWGARSAQETIELTEHFIESYSVDPERVYAMGYSAGGETLSRVMNTHAELFTAYLHCSSQWNGGFEDVVKNQIPVYIFMAQNDEYYGAEPALEANRALRDLYSRSGLTTDEIDRLVVLDMPDNSYFHRQGIRYYHAGGKAVANSMEPIRWILAQK